jgi:hypothetical protein
METMGRSIQFANKTIGAATIAAGSQRETLKALGYTEKEITSGQVTAIDVMMKLAGEYDKHIDRNVIAKHTVDMFGRSGGALTKVLAEGTTALRERIEAMKVYSEQEVKAAAAADRAVERGERAAKAGLKNFAVNFGAVYTRVAVGNAYADAVENEFKGKVGFFGDARDPSIEDVSKNSGSVTRMAKKVAMEGRRKGLSTEDVMTDLNRRVEEDWTLSNSQKDVMSMVAGRLQDMVEKEKKGASPESVVSKVSAVMSSSSLQAIGGGDVSSILSGTYQEDMLDATKKTAESVTQLKDGLLAPGPAAKKLTPANK